MIKRLKWNVLYAEGAQDGSDLSDSSAESIERGSATAQAVLDQLATNDPNFATTLDLQSYASSSDADDTKQQKKDYAQYPAAPEQQLSNHSDDADYAEWRECDLCPGKRFLNDGDVQAHLSSKRHARALKRFDALSIRENKENPASSQNPLLNADIRTFAQVSNSAERDHFQISSSPGATNRNQKKTSSSRDTQNTQQPDKADQLNANDEPNMTEEQKRKADKRRAAVKRRLRRLKQKKWEKKAQDEGVANITTSQAENQTMNKIASENGHATEQKREKIGKVRSRREKPKVQGPSDIDKHGGDDADAEASPSSQVWERKKRNKRKSKETSRENKSNGSRKHKKLRKARETVAGGDVVQ